MSTRFLGSALFALLLSLTFAVSWTTTNPVVLSAFQQFDCYVSTDAALYNYSNQQLNSGHFDWGPAQEFTESACFQLGQTLILQNVGQFCRDAGLGAGQGYVTESWSYTWLDHLTTPHSNSYNAQYDCGDGQ